jgi:hypothetical protein
MGARRIAAELVSVGDLTGALRFLEALMIARWPRGDWPPMSDAGPLAALLRPFDGQLRRSATSPRPWPATPPRDRSPRRKAAR